jgi:hypothetical protein
MPKTGTTFVDGADDGEGYYLFGNESIYDYGYKYLADEVDDEGNVTVKFEFKYDKIVTVEKMLFDSRRAELEYSNNAKNEKDFFAVYEESSIVRNERLYKNALNFIVKKYKL